MQSGGDVGAVPFDVNIDNIEDCQNYSYGASRVMCKLTTKARMR